MFGASESNSKNRRKSFFSFGGSQTASKSTATKIPGIKNKETIPDHSHERHSTIISSSKAPTNRKGESQNQSNVLQSSEPHVSIAGSPVLPGEDASDRGTFTFPTNSTTKRNVSHLRRPPPPTIDLEVLKVFKESTLLHTSGSGNVSQPSSTDETLKSPSYSPARTPVGSIDELNTAKHRRQRSEAEKLVDDLDSYIQEHQESSKSPQFEMQGSAAGLLDPGIDTDSNSNSSRSERLSSDSPLESPFTYVGPLNLTHEEGRHLLGHASSLHSGKKLGDSSDLEAENDRFSFTTSLNDKSVSSVQQIALNDSTGVAPVLTNYSYDYKNTISEANTGRFYSSGSDQKDSSTHSSNREFLECEGSPSIEGSRSGRSHEKKDYEIRGHGTSFDSELSAPRNFRVVNEERASFYLNNGDSQTISTATTTTTEEEENNGSKQYTELEQRQISTKYDSGLQSFPPVGGMNLDDVVLETKNTTSHPENLKRMDEEDDSLSEKLQNSSDQTVLSPPSVKSGEDSLRRTSTSPKLDKTVRLVSSYVEELRLKYYTTSNFLQAPPNLPISLKQKNNLIQPKNIKVRIRTSSKQIGIKHGGAKQKLLSLETTKEEGSGNANVKFLEGRGKINVDHTKEFHNLLNKGADNQQQSFSNDAELVKSNDYAYGMGDGGDYYLDDIPGDEAYNSDDAMAPLRESQNSRKVSRSNTVISYFTKNQQRLRSGTLENNYDHLQGLPTNINIEDYRKDFPNKLERSTSSKSSDSGLIEPVYSYGNVLHVANPDTDSD